MSLELSHKDASFLASQPTEFRDLFSGAAKNRSSRKFAEMRALCRSLPQEIDLEILDFIEISLAVSENLSASRFLRMFAGVFTSSKATATANKRTRQPSVIFRSINIGSLSRLYHSLSQAEIKGGLSQAKKSMFCFLLRNVRHLSIAVTHSYTIPQLQTLCTKNRLFESVRGVSLTANTRKSVETLLPSQLAQNVRSVSIQQKVQGLNKLPNLTSLELDGGDISDIDVSGLKKLFVNVGRARPAGDDQWDRIFNNSKLQKSIEIQCVSDLDSLVPFVGIEAGKGLKKLDITLTECWNNVQLSALPSACTSLTLDDCAINSLAGIDSLQNIKALSLKGLGHAIDISALLSGCKKMDSLQISQPLVALSSAQESVLRELITRGQLKNLDLEFYSNDEQSFLDCLRRIGFGAPHPGQTTNIKLRSLSLRSGNIDFTSLQPLLYLVLAASCVHTLENLVIQQFDLSLEVDCAKMTEFLETSGAGTLLSVELGIPSSKSS